MGCVGLANTISRYFTDEDLEQSLRMHFPYEQMWDVDFKTVFSHIKDTGKYFTLRFRGKVFSIDKVTGSVVKVEELVL